MIVNKQPLWWWAKQDKIHLIDIPFKEIEIFQLKYLGEFKVNNLQEEIENKINTLHPGRYSDFRVPTIMEIWKSNLKDYNIETTIYQYEATVSSGTYIRSLVNRVGDELGIGALAFDINRIKFC